MILKHTLDVKIPNAVIRKILTSTFFDEDGIECITLGMAHALFPDLDWPPIEKRFVWVKGCERSVECMTLQDLLFVSEHKDWESYEYKDVTHCHICRKTLLPDDEAYNAVYCGRGLTLCDEHSSVNEQDDCYEPRVFL